MMMLLIMIEEDAEFAHNLNLYSRRWVELEEPRKC